MDQQWNVTYLYYLRDDDVICLILHVILWTLVYTVSVFWDENTVEHIIFSITIERRRTILQLIAYSHPMRSLWTLQKRVWVHFSCVDIIVFLLFYLFCKIIEQFELIQLYTWDLLFPSNQLIYKSFNKISINDKRIKWFET